MIFKMRFHCIFTIWYFFYRSNVAEKKKNPPTDDPTAQAKKTPVRRPKKREWPNIFSTRDHFKATDTNEVVLKNTDVIKEIKNFRMFLNEEKTRGISFMMNEFMASKNNYVTTPTLLFSNFWNEKPECIKNPATDDGSRETASKFKPRDIPIIKEALTVIMALNPDLYKNLPAPEFNAQEFLARVRKGLKGLTMEQPETMERADIQEVNDEDMPTDFCSVANNNWIFSISDFSNK